MFLFNLTFIWIIKYNKYKSYLAVRDENKTKKTQIPDKGSWLMSQVSARPVMCVTAAWFLCLVMSAIPLLVSSPHEDDNNLTD